MFSDGLKQHHRPSEKQASFFLMKTLYFVLSAVYPRHTKHNPI